MAGLVLPFPGLEPEDLDMFDSDDTSDNVSTEGDSDDPQAVALDPNDDSQFDTPESLIHPSHILREDQILLYSDWRWCHICGDDLIALTPHDEDYWLSRLRVRKSLCARWDLRDSDRYPSQNEKRDSRRCIPHWCRLS